MNRETTSGERINSGEVEGFAIRMRDDAVKEPLRLAFREVIFSGLYGERFDKPTGVADLAARLGGIGTTITTAHLATTLYIDRLRDQDRPRERGGIDHHARSSSRVRGDGNSAR